MTGPGWAAVRDPRVSGSTAAEYSNRADRQRFNAAEGNRDETTMSQFRVLMPQVRDERRGNGLTTRRSDRTGMLGGEGGSLSNSADLRDRESPALSGVAQTGILRI